MKKVILKNAFVALILTLGFLFSGAVESNAQVMSTAAPSTGNQLYTQPVGNFVGANDAQAILKAEMISIKGQLAGLSGPPANALILRLTYYNGIYESLQAGKDVPEAIVSGLAYVRGNPQTGPSTTTLNNLKQVAIDLLS